MFNFFLIVSVTLGVVLCLVLAAFSYLHYRSCLVSKDGSKLYLPGILYPTITVIFSDDTILSGFKYEELDRCYSRSVETSGITQLLFFSTSAGLVLWEGPPDADIHSPAKYTTFPIFSRHTQKIKLLFNI